MAAVTWRELVFIFKETKFFVLWGEGVGADGTPTFQRPRGRQHGRARVHAGGRRRPRRRLLHQPPRRLPHHRRRPGAAVGHHAARCGRSDPEVYFRSQPINLAQLDLVRMRVARRAGSSSPSRPARARSTTALLVYDTQHQWWIGLRHRRVGARRLPLAPTARAASSATRPGRSAIGHRAHGSTSDRDQPITSRWRSGWGDYDNSQAEDDPRDEGVGHRAPSTSASRSTSCATSAPASRRCSGCPVRIGATAI